MGSFWQVGRQATVPSTHNNIATIQQQHNNNQDFTN